MFLVDIGFRNLQGVLQGQFWPMVTSHRQVIYRLT